MKPKILILLALFFISCDYNDGRLNIKNNSNHIITFDYSNDTILDQINNIEAILNDSIDIGGISYILKPGSMSAWTTYIEQSKNKKLNIFIFNADTLSMHPDWKYIIYNKLYKRYEFTEEELDKMNWTIKYP